MIKLVIYGLIIVICSYLGICKAKTYETREIELKKIKNALSFFKSKIAYTYEPVKEIFMQISNSVYENEDNVFFKYVENLKNANSKDAWNSAVDEMCINISKEDRDILKMFGKLLGKTDKNGQISEIELTQNFIDKQISRAEADKAKNMKLYKSLGVICGVGIVIFLA